MINLKSEIEISVNRRIMDIKEAKRLKSLNWKAAAVLYPIAIQKDIEVFFLFVDGLIEEVVEGFVAGDKSDDELLSKAKELLEKL